MIAERQDLHGPNISCGPKAQKNVFFQPPDIELSFQQQGGYGYIRSFDDATFNLRCKWTMVHNGMSALLAPSWDSIKKLLIVLCLRTTNKQYLHLYLQHMEVFHASQLVWTKWKRQQQQQQQHPVLSLWNYLLS